MTSKKQHPWRAYRQPPPKETTMTKTEDTDDEPHRVPCSYPGCTNLTTVDPIYGDLCYEHIRADNE